MSSPRPTILLLGVSVRALAESAAAAGYSVTTIDGFADLDTAIVADARRVTPYSASAAVRAAEGVPGDVVCFTSNIDNNPRLLGRLLRGRTLWGNSRIALDRARDPVGLARAMTAGGVPAPGVRRRSPSPRTLDARRKWLIKPRASGGGHGIAPWTSERPVSRRHVLQERIAGVPASILFVSDGRASLPFAVTRQLVGDRRFGARPFRYCGNLLGTQDDPQWGVHSPLARTGHLAASVATDAFGLVGVNGIDVIVRPGHVVPIEVNPRYTAAMELVERRDALSIFATHVAGSTRRLGDVSLPTPEPGAMGKAIVFARRACTVGDTERWLADPDIRDVPHPGSIMPRGAPICTVFAAGDTMDACYHGLVARAAAVYREVER